MKPTPHNATSAQPDEPSADPFLLRLQGIIEDWIVTEWDRREAIRHEADSIGWNHRYAVQYKNAFLTPFTLAHRVDNMSLSKLRRELDKLGAPSPGELIRKARLAHAAQLLTHTRLQVKQVALQSGYRSEKHFTDTFKATYDATPSDYRRDFIGNHHHRE